MCRNDSYYVVPNAGFQLTACAGTFEKIIHDCDELPQTSQTARLPTPFCGMVCHANQSNKGVSVTSWAFVVCAICIDKIPVSPTPTAPSPCVHGTSTGSQGPIPSRIRLRCPWLRGSPEGLHAHCPVQHPPIPHHAAGSWSAAIPQVQGRYPHVGTP